jgi:DNA-binding transcriptional ArsR family regulator
MWTSEEDRARGEAPAVARVARTARALADPRRVAVLSMLRDAPAAVTEIAAQIGARPAEASRQLAELRATGLVASEHRGRCRWYSVDADRVGRLLDELGRSSLGQPAPPARSQPPVGSPLRLARTCYDHLAGAVAVEFAAELERRAWLVATPSGYVVTALGERRLLDRGVFVAQIRGTRRRLASRCLDWTERRPHIGGAVGAELLRSLQGGGYLARGPARTVRVRRPLLGWVQHPRRADR